MTKKGKYDIIQKTLSRNTWLFKRIKFKKERKGILNEEEFNGNGFYFGYEWKYGKINRGYHWWV